MKFTITHTKLEGKGPPVSNHKVSFSTKTISEEEKAEEITRL